VTTKVAVYVRVSTLNQVQDQTIEQQLQRLQDHIAAQGWQLQDEHIFRDDGYSGATLNRPGLDHLRDAMRWGDVTHLLITDPDRLARKYVHQICPFAEMVLTLLNLLPMPCRWWVIGPAVPECESAAESTVSRDVSPAPEGVRW
jgi:DNA invertase Pin-like site-specific DNA recombinase